MFDQLNIFPANAPTLGGIEFDAVLQDTLEASSTLTTYELEIGARPADHRIVNPIQYTMIVAISNSPLGVSLTDFTGLIPDRSGLISTVAGLAAGFLAGSNGTRSSDALDMLLALWVSGELLDIDAGDKTLVNMVIKSVRRVKDPSNENALIAEVALQEFPFLESTLAANGVSQDLLEEGQPEQTMAAALVNKGEVGLTSITSSIQSSLDNVLGV